MKWYLQVLRKYAVFSGRARRKEYWMFALFNIIFLYAAILLDNILGTTFQGLLYGVFYLLYTLAILIPGLAVTVRRLHDVGKSGWMILISLIPVIGGIWLLVLMVTDSEPDKNNYGESPKDAQEDDVMANQKTNDWARSLDDETLATALLDRFLFKCQLINLKGKSYRMQNRKTIFENEKN